MDQGILRAAARLRWGVFVVSAVIASLYLAARFDLRLGWARVEYRNHGANPAAAQFIADGTVLLVLVALFHLTQMLRLIQQGELFSVEVIRAFRGFAFWLLLMALFGVLAPILLPLAPSAPGRPHHLAVMLDLRDLLTLGLTLLLFVLARLLERAREIEAEMREIV